MIHVLSVPHTGSRTLITHLGLRWEDHLPRHFGYDDTYIKSLGTQTVHIPVRDPIQTLMSWRARGLSLDRCIHRCMGALVQYHNPKVIYYRVEDLPGNVGEHPPRDTKARIIAGEAWKLAPAPIKDFYVRFYSRIE